MNTENKFFESKEHYLNFRKAWAIACSSARAKSTTEPCDEWITTTGWNGYVSKGTGTHRVYGWLRAEHHILYNILRNKPVDNGFTLISNVNKLTNGFYLNQGLFWSFQTLKFIVGKAQRVAETTTDLLLEKAKARMNARSNRTSDLEYHLEAVTNTFEHEKRSVIEFLEPFGGMVTIEMLAAITLPKIKPLVPKFPLEEKKQQPITSVDLSELYERA